MDRKRQRALDISESYFLLLDLCNSEPIIQQCFYIIENICLAHGVTMSGKKPTPDFQRHIDLYYMTFLRMAIRAMHTYGFVPWRLMTLESGDKVPEVLPLGTFRWSVEPPNEENRKYSSQFRDAMLVYVVRINPGARQEEDLHVTQWLAPNNVSENSVMYATVPSPLSGIIESFKHLQAASQRLAHADAWNCTARIVVSNEPKEYDHDQQRRELFGTFHQHLDQHGRLHPHKPTTVADRLDETFYNRSMNHYPAVYTLPAHHHLDVAPELKPCVDVIALQAKYKNDVCSLLGVPPEMVTSVQHSTTEKHAKTSGVSSGTSRIFQAKMQTVTNFLKTLLAEVYRTTYKGAEARFDIVPMPRLEISSIEDLKVLHEIGVLQPEHTVDLASLLLGKLKKAKTNPLETFGQVQDPKAQDQKAQDAKNQDTKKKENNS
jgi:hypothetical protein